MRLSVLYYIRKSLPTSPGTSSIPASFAFCAGVLFLLAAGLNARPAVAVVLSFFAGPFNFVVLGLFLLRLFCSSNSSSSGSPSLAMSGPDEASSMLTSESSPAEELCRLGAVVGTVSTSGFLVTRPDLRRSGGATVEAGSFEGEESSMLEFRAGMGICVILSSSFLYLVANDMNWFSLRVRILFAQRQARRRSNSR